MIGWWNMKWLPAGLSWSVENFLIAINIKNINPFIASCHPIFCGECCYLELKHLYIRTCSYNLCHVMILPLKINFKPWIGIVQGWWPGRSGRGDGLIWNPVQKCGHGIKSLSVFNHCKYLFIPVFTVNKTTRHPILLKIVYFRPILEIYRNKYPFWSYL